MYRIKDRGNRVGFIRQHRVCVLIIYSSTGSGCHLPDIKLGEWHVERNLEYPREYEQMH